MNDYCRNRGRQCDRTHRDIAFRSRGFSLLLLWEGLSEVHAKDLTAESKEDQICEAFMAVNPISPNPKNCNKVSWTNMSCSVGGVNLKVGALIEDEICEHESVGAPGSTVPLNRTLLVGCGRFAFAGPVEPAGVA